MTELERAEETRDAIYWGLNAIEEQEPVQVACYEAARRMLDVWVREVHRLKAAEKEPGKPPRGVNACHGRIDKVVKRCDDQAEVIRAANAMIEQLTKDVVKLQAAASDRASLADCSQICSDLGIAESKIEGLEAEIQKVRKWCTGHKHDFPAWPRATLIPSDCSQL